MASSSLNPANWRQTFLEVKPSASLTIIDESSHIGGVWSYPYSSFKIQNKY